MQRTSVSQLHRHPGEIVTVAGFVRTVRDQKRMQFIVVADRTGVVQVSHERGEDERTAAVSSLGAGSAVVITGEVVVDPRIRAGGLELRLRSLDVPGPCNAKMPVSADSAPEHRMDWRFVDLRRPENALVFEIQTAAEHAMRRFWIERGFLEIHSPKLMAAASESGAELFTLPYFGGTASLAQSPQFYKQMAMAAGFERVFEIGPVFRANPSFTSRHDTEFTSVDVEIAWIDSHEDVMRLEETWLAAVVSEIAGRFGQRVRDAFGVEIRVPTLPFPRLTLAEAHGVLASLGHRSLREDGDLDPEGERLLGEHVRRERGHDFVFVTDWPASIRPFYHMRSEADATLTKGFDLLWKGVEVTSGAQREHRPERLVAQIREKGLAEAPLEDYVNFFRYGCPPHGGYGFGLSRMLMVLLGRPNVREVTYLYRGPTRLRP